MSSRSRTSSAERRSRREVGSVLSASSASMLSSASRTSSRSRCSRKNSKRPSTAAVCTGYRPWFPRSDRDAHVSRHPATKRTITMDLINRRKERKWKVIENIPKSPPPRRPKQKRRVTNRFTDLVIAWRHLDNEPMLDANGKEFVTHRWEAAPLYSSFTEDCEFPDPLPTTGALVSPINKMSKVEMQRRLLRKTRSSLYKLDSMRCSSRSGYRDSSTDLLRPSTYFSMP